MKKILALVLALTMVAAMAACTPANNNDTTTEATGTTTEATTEATTPAASFASALELLNAVWQEFPGREEFPAMGGDEANINWEGPGKVELAGVEGNPLWNLNIPEDQLSNFTEAATLCHAMNTNTFASCALKLADHANKKAVAKAIADGILGTHWMCGFPDRMIVASVGDYLVVAFGQGGNMVNFVNSLNKVDAGAQILHDEAIH